MTFAPPKIPIRVETDVLIVGRRRIPLREVEQAYAQPQRPSVRLSLVALGVATCVGVPAVNAVAAAGRLVTAAILFAVAGAVFLGALYQLVWADERYALVVRRAGVDETLLRSSDAQQVVSLVAQIQGAPR